MYIMNGKNFIKNYTNVRKETAENLQIPTRTLIFRVYLN